MGGWGTTRSDRESFTVDADRERADLWREAAAERCMSVPSWLADTADVHLAELARTGRATPLLMASGPLPGPVDGHLPESLRRGRCRGPGARLAAVRHLPGDHPRGGRSWECRAHPRAPPHRADPRHPSPPEELHGVGGGAGGRWRSTGGSDPERVLVGAPDQEKAQALIRLYEKSPPRRDRRSKIGGRFPLWGPPLLVFPGRAER